MRVAISWAHTWFSCNKPVTSVCQTLSITEATVIEGTICVAKFSWELNISWEIFKLRSVCRTCSIELVRGWIYSRITKLSLSRVTLVIDELDVSSSCGRSIWLSETQGWGSLCFWYASCSDTSGCLCCWTWLSSSCGRCCIFCSRISLRIYNDR